MSGPEDNPADDDPHHECRHEIDRLSAALRDIISTYERRSELFTNADDCAGNLADRARKAAQELIDYENIGGPDYLHWQERFDALSAALEKTT